MSQSARQTFTCPHCNKRFQWTTKIADRKAQCPSCHKRIRIPTVPGRVAEAVDPLPKQPKPDRKDDTNTYELDLTGIDETIVEPPPTPAQQAAAQTGRCPACNQSIKPGAVICIKCGYNLKKGKRMQTAVTDPDAPVDTSGLPGGSMPGIGSSSVLLALEDGEDDVKQSSKLLNLWLPLGLILLGLVVSFVEQLYFTGDATAGAITAIIYVGVNLAVKIPVLLIGMILAVKLLDVAFGPLGQALFKLTAVVLGPAAIGAIIEYLIGGVPGAFAGGFFQFCVYWALLSLLFDLEGMEALYLIFIIWALNWLATFFIIGLLMGLFG